MIFIRGVGARIQIWSTIVYWFLLVLKSVTTAVGGIYACLLFLCKQLENYLWKITQTAVEHLPPSPSLVHLPLSPSLVLHDYCILIIERTCIIRELCSNHFSKVCDSIVTRRQFNIRLLYFVLFLSQEIKKFPDTAFHNLPSNERRFFKDLDTVRRHCLCWLNSSIHSLQLFILLHVCMHRLHCFIPITVCDIANIKKTINVFTVKSSESIGYRTKEASVSLANANRCLDDGNLRQPTAIKVESKLCNKTRAIKFSHNLPKIIGVNEQADVFKNDSRNVSLKGNCTKRRPCTSNYSDFNVPKIPEDLPENLFDCDEKEEPEKIRIEEKDSLKGILETSHGDFNVTKIPEDLPENLFDSDEKEEPETIRIEEKDLLKGIFETSHGDFNVTKIPEDLRENLFDSDEKEEPEKIIERDVLKEPLKISHGNVNVAKVWEESPEIKSDENKNDGSGGKTQQVRPDKEYFTQEIQTVPSLDNLKVEKNSERIPVNILDNDNIIDQSKEVPVKHKEQVNTPQNSIKVPETKKVALVKLNEQVNTPRNPIKVPETKDVAHVKLKEQVNTPQNPVKVLETKPVHASKSTTKQGRNKKCNLKEIVATGNSKLTKDSMYLKIPKVCHLEIRRFLSQHGVSYKEFARNRSLKNYSVFSLQTPLKAQKPIHVTSDKIVINIEDKTAISLLKQADKPCDELSELKLLFYFALKGEICVLATSAKWITFSSSYCQKVKQKYKEKFNDVMVCLCIKIFVLEFCDFHFKNIKGNYEVTLYCLQNLQKYYAIGLDKTDKFSIGKDDRHSIIYPSEFADSGRKFVPYYDWELFVDDGVDVDEELSNSIDDSIQEPKIATTVYEYTVGYGTLPDRLKNMLKIKFPAISNHSDVTVRFPVMTPQEIVADKGKQFVFLNWWTNFFLKTGADSTQSIEDAFSHFLTRESKRKKQIEAKPTQDDNFTLNIQSYQQRDFERALIGEDVRITPIPEVSSIVKAKEIPSTVPFRNEKLEDCYFGIDINTILSNDQRMDKGSPKSKIPEDSAIDSCNRQKQADTNGQQTKRREEESQKSKIPEDPQIDSCNRLKQTNTNCDQSKQNSTENDQNYDCNKKKNKSSRKKSSRKKRKKASDEVGQRQITEDANDNKDDKDLICRKTDNDQQAQKKVPKETDIPKQTQVTVDKLLNESVQEMVTTKKTKIKTPKQLITNEPENDLSKNGTIDEEIDIKEANIGRMIIAQPQAINYKAAYDTTQKLPSMKLEESNQKDVTIIKKIKCNKNKNAVKISSDSNSVKMNDLNIPCNSVSMSKLPKVPKCEKSSVHVSEDLHLSLRPFNSTTQGISRESTPIHVKELQNSSKGIVNYQNLRDSAQLARSKDAGNTSVAFKNSNTSKLCSETDKNLEVTRRISQLNRAMESKPVANSQSIKSRSSQLLLSSCPDLNLKIHSKVLSQKTTELLQSKSNSSENNQTIYEPLQTSQLETTQDVQTKDETMTFKLYSDVLKQKKSVPVHSPIDKIANNQLVPLEISKLLKSSSKIPPGFTASPTLPNASVFSMCSIARTTSLYLSDTITSACSRATDSSSIYPGDRAITTSFMDSISLSPFVTTLSTCFVVTPTYQTVAATTTCPTDTTALSCSSATLPAIYLGDTVTSTSISSGSFVTTISTCLVATPTCPIVVTTPACLIDTTTPTSCSATVSSMYLADTTDTTSAIGPIATTSSTCHGDTAESTSIDTNSSCSVTTISACPIVATTSPFVVGTTSSTFSSATVSSMHHGYTAASTNFTDTTSSICPIATTLSTYPVATSASKCSIYTTSWPVATISKCLVTPTCPIVATTSTCRSDTAATTFSGATVSSMYHGDTAESKSLIDTTLSTSPIITTLSTSPIITTLSTCPDATAVTTCIVTTLTSAIASSTYPGATTSSTFSSVTVSTCSGDAAVKTYPIATDASTCTSANAASTCFNTSAGKILNPTVASACLSPKVDSTKSDLNSSLEHNKLLSSKVRRSPDQRQSLTVAQRLSATFLKIKSEPVQNRTQTKDSRAIENSIAEEAPSNLGEMVAPEHSVASANSPKNELLTKLSAPLTTAPTTQIAQEVVPKKSQTKDQCDDPPKVQAAKETTKIPTTECDANPNENFPEKVSKNLLMTDSESESSDSSESKSPVSKYKFSGVRQKLRSDIAEKLTEVMRKKVKGNSKAKPET